MTQHYWNHFEYTDDMEFLKKRAYPAIKSVAHFYSDWLIEDPRDGYLISAPSTSPENRYLNKNNEPVASCLGSAMDQQIIFEVFRNFLKGSEILNIENNLTTKIRNQIKKLRPGFIIDKNNQLQSRSILVLKKYNEFVIAKDNLKAGERLVITKLSTASNGITVNPIYQ